VKGLRTGLTGFITGETCPCGRAGPRLLNIDAAQDPAMNQPLAASA
jgi:hypothetical protein